MSNENPVKTSQRRRTFLKTLTAGAAAALWPSPAVSGANRNALVGASRENAGGSMLYRRLGRTGLMISEISLGGSPLPDEGLLRSLIERGVNYIDTSDSYENGNCERKVGRLFKDFGRDRIHIHARFHLNGPWSEKTIIASVEGSLRRLGTDHADVLGIHGVENPDHVQDERVLAAFEKLKGKYRFRGLTCHVNAQAVIPRAVASGVYDMVQIGYNVFDIQETAKEVKTYSDYLGQSGLGRLIDLCHSKDVGVTGMKVLKVGGRRQELAPGGPPLIPAMLKWALANNKLAAVVTEIMNEREMEEDLGAVGRPLAGAEKARLEEHVAANAGAYCHSCGLCQAACPAAVPTARASRALAYADSYRKNGRARAEAAFLKTAAVRCRDCGACERACPYGLSVRERTLRAARLSA